MHKLLCLLFLLGAATLAQAQMGTPYFPLVRGEALYRVALADTGSDFRLDGYSIDSVAFDSVTGDSLYYAAAVSGMQSDYGIDYSSYQGYESGYSYSMVGQQVHYSSSMGKVYFAGAGYRAPGFCMNRVIEIRPSARPGEIGIRSYMDTGLYSCRYYPSYQHLFDGFVESIQLDTFAGMTDSVKTIRARNQVWKLSRRYGLVQAYGLYGLDTATPKRLVSVDARDYARQHLLTVRQWFDVQPGDVIHYEGLQSSSRNGSLSGTAYAWKRKIMAVTWAPDSSQVAFTVLDSNRTTSFTYTQGLPPIDRPVDSIVTKEVTVNLDDYAFLDGTHFMPYALGSNAHWVGGQWLFKRGDNTYNRGNPLPSYHRSVNAGTAGSSEWEWEVVYQKMARFGESGHPIILNSKKHLDRAQVNLYPNPAKSGVSISVPVATSVQWRLISSTGQEIAQGSGGTSQFINRGNIPTGIYGLQIITADGRQGTFKVVFE